MVKIHYIHVQKMSALFTEDLEPINDKIKWISVCDLSVTYMNTMQLSQEVHCSLTYEIKKSCFYFDINL
jgi:hypothetical protein